MRVTVRKLLESPLLLASVAYLLAIVVIGPWGDFPLNDDWQYAHLTKHWAETGRWVVDTHTAPSLIGQALIAVPWIKILGFSHLLLRAITICLGWAGLWAISSILCSLGTTARVRSLILLVAVFNPLYLYFSTTYMTEMYGYSIALVGAACWFRSARPTPSWRAALGSAAIIGATFWIRQFCVVVFPAVLVAWICGLSARERRQELRSALPRVLAACGVFCATVLLYFLCAFVGGWTTDQFKGPFGRLLVPNRGWIVQPGLFIQYMTWFLCPLLVLFPWRQLDLRRSLLVSALLALPLGTSLIFVHRSMLWNHAPFNPAGDYFRNGFPHWGNVLHRAGVGPILLSDLGLHPYRDSLELPAWVWSLVEFVVTLLSIQWIAAVGRRADGLRKDLRALAVFGVAFAFLAMTLAWQAYGFEMFDRYCFPGFLGLLFFLAGRLNSTVKAIRPILFAILLLPIAVYSVGGLHDQFRWNDVRWKLRDEVIRLGVPPGNIEGGIEMDGWNSLENQDSPLNCIGPCHCEKAEWWPCVDASYRIGVWVRPGYTMVQSAQPTYWLTDGPALIVSRRTGTCH